MNLYHLRYFVQLAQTQHYTHAAEQLHITQPSLSHAIAQLEEELGVPLFERIGRNTTLTRCGEEFLVCARNTLATLNAGVESMQQTARGEGIVRLGLLRTLGVEYVPRLANGFLAEHPGKNIRFTFNTGATGQLLEGLSARRYDLVFCSCPPDELCLNAESVGKQDLVLITPCCHPLAERRCVDLQDTLPYPQIFFSRGSGLRDVVEGMFDHIQAKPQIAYETEEDQVIAGLVAQGFGIAVVPYMELLHQLQVEILQIANPIWERNFYIVSDDRSFLAPAAQHFRSYVLEHTRKIHTE